MAPELQVGISESEISVKVYKRLAQAFGYLWDQNKPSVIYLDKHFVFKLPFFPYDPKDLELLDDLFKHNWIGIVVTNSFEVRKDKMETMAHKVLSPGKLLKWRPNYKCNPETIAKSVDCILENPSWVNLVKDNGIYSIGDRRRDYLCFVSQTIYLEEKVGQRVQKTFIQIESPGDSLPFCNIIG